MTAVVGGEPRGPLGPVHAAPAGQHVTMGIDPGIRTGCEIAVVDATGKLLDTATIYPHEPRCDWAGSISTIARLASAHGVSLVAIGNGTASRETDKLVQDVMKKYPEARLTKIVVSEAGASVYSASELAAKEFPDLDVSIRGAVSIARRLQDPLAELVKIEPKSIGVGQYQHDVSQTKLARSLDAVVEDCVNAVGVDVNTASVPLLTRISGLNAGLAANIVGKADNTNNRYQVAAKMNRLMTDQPWPFWGAPASQAQRWLTTTKPPEGAGADIPEFRATEDAARRGRLQPKSVWQMHGAGAVGGDEGVQVGG